MTELTLKNRSMTEKKTPSPPSLGDTAAARRSDRATNRASKICRRKNRALSGWVKCCLRQKFQTTM